MTVLFMLIGMIGSYYIGKAHGRKEMRLDIESKVIPALDKLKEKIDRNELVKPTPPKSLIIKEGEI